MEVIDEISLSILRVIPGAVLILRLKDEIQISLSYFPVSLFGEIVRCTRQQESPICVCIYYCHRLFRIGGVGTSGCICGSLKILIVEQSMVGYRFHYSKPFIRPVNFPNLFKSLVHVRYGRYEGCSFSYRTPQRFPVEWISPTIVAITCTSSAFEDFKEVKRSFVKTFFFQAFRKKGKSHRIVRISYWKSLALPKNAPGRRHKCFGENHWRHRQDPQQRLPVIQGLGVSRQVARVKTLKVRGNFSVSREPINEVENSFQSLLCLQT